LKILYLSPAGRSGGAERVLIDSLASLRAAYPDWELELIAASDGELVQEAEALGVRSRVMPFPRALAAIGDAGAGGPAGNRWRRYGIAVRLAIAAPAIALYLGKLRRLIGQSRPDVIHSNGFKMHLLGSRAAARRTPVIWHMHDFASRRPMMSRLLRAEAGRCAGAIAISRSVAGDLRATLGEKTPITTVYNAVDLRRFVPQGPRLDLDALAAMPPAERGTVRIGLLATMARWKGHEVFLRAIARIACDKPFRAYVIGGPLYETDGSQYSLSALRATARELGLGEHVGFTGFVKDPAAALRALDIVVHASTEPEPFGLVIAEAMACGRAVIASAGGGAAEIVNAGTDALTHRPGDNAMLAELIAQLASDPDRRRRLGCAAAATASRRFGRERLAYELAPIYQAAIEQAANADYH
jgi:glycosyltransferase involved in cell wall biosynthesis